MDSLKVGIREFRSQLPHYLLEVGQPLAITRHGETIGYYIPTRDKTGADDLKPFGRPPKSWIGCCRRLESSRTISLKSSTPGAANPNNAG
jgi:antitoxin (DNA-binding transcriptional repressor) of toxin-antitoxin stability system